MPLSHRRLRRYPLLTKTSAESAKPSAPADFRFARVAPVPKIQPDLKLRLQSFSAGLIPVDSEPLLSSQTTNRSSGLAAKFEVRAAAASERPSFIDLEIIQWDPAYIPASNRCTSLSGEVDEEESEPLLPLFFCLDKKCKSLTKL